MLGIKDSTTTGILTVYLGLSSDQQAAADTIVEAQDNIRNMATGSIAVHVSRTVNEVADSQEDLSKLLDSLEILVARIGVIVRMGDEFAKVRGCIPCPTPLI